MGPPKKNPTSLQILCRISVHLIMPGVVVLPRYQHQNSKSPSNFAKPLVESWIISGETNFSLVQTSNF